MNFAHFKIIMPKKLIGNQENVPEASKKYRYDKIGRKKALGFDACGVELPYTKRNGIKNYDAVYGLGKKCGCYGRWLVSTTEGNKVLDKAKIKGKKIVEENQKQHHSF